jgi:hypothetical protein
VRVGAVAFCSHAPRPVWQHARFEQSHWEHNAARGTALLRGGLAVAINYHVRSTGPRRFCSLASVALRRLAFLNSRGRWWGARMGLPSPLTKTPPLELQCGAWHTTPGWMRSN